MSFSVEPEGLKAAAAKYEACADQLAITRDYNLTHADLPWHEVGFIVALNSLHNDFAGLLRNRLAQAADLLAASSEQLRMAADAYILMDQDAAARLDATYPAFARPDTNQPLGQ